MLYRKVMEQLKEWKEAKTKKTLCITGARQIGKTTLVREFGKQFYKDFLEINFITDPTAKIIFAKQLDANTLCENITAYARRSLTPGNTLILLDEIQECPEARTAIKFLTEDGRFDIIETGSLLGVNFQKVHSYPVGFEKIIKMYPLDLEEFLLANGVRSQTFAYLHECFEKKQPVSEAVHATMNKLFGLYVVVGGMPQVVQEYVENHDIGKVVELQKSIMVQYRLDIAKYADKNEKIKIGWIFDSLPNQLNNKNRRFKLSEIAVSGRMNRYEACFRWLEDAGVGLPCYNVVEPQVPLMLNTKHNLFKLYLNDTGMLCSSCLDNVQLEILQGNLQINLGSILENMFAQQLCANGYNLRYYDSKKYGEIDFVVENSSSVDLVEIKSGKNYHQHRALDKISSVEEWKFGRKLVFCCGNLEVADNVVYVPWYMVMFYQPQKLPYGLYYQVDLQGL